MSEQLKPIEQLRSASASRNPRNQPHEPYDSFFRGDFRRLFEYLERLCKGKPTQQSQRDALTDATRWLAISLLKNTAFQGLVMVFVLVAIGAALYAWNIAVDENGKIDPNWVIALLTLAIVFSSILQWAVIKKQTDEFVTQNEIMIEQNKTLLGQLEHARASSAQTDEMISHMRQETRPWVATSITTHGTLSGAYEDTKELDLPIVVRNEGKTPAIITHSLVDFQTNFKPDLHNLERVARTRQRKRTVLGPQDMFVFNIRQRDGRLPVTLAKTFAEEIEAGRMDAYLSGVFIYEDAQGTEHKTTCCYKYGNNAQGFIGYPEDGDMT